jgi:DIS3-like exonuclease 2
MIAAQCNKQKYNAKRAGEMSTELYTLKYIELNSPVTMQAVVVEIREKYIDTIIVSMGLNRRIFFNNVSKLSFVHLCYNYNVLWFNINY